MALKGTDGKALEEALRRGAKMIAPDRARRFLRGVRSLNLTGLEFLTADGLMGSQELNDVGLGYVIVYKPEKWPTTAKDTIEAVKRCIAGGAELIAFVGGDGTARDVVQGVRESRAATPILGVPSGVKVYSSVFAVRPEDAAKALADWLENPSTCSGEVVDVDEEAFRRGELRVKLYAVVATPCSRVLVGSSKQPGSWGYDEVENAKAIADYIVENLEDCTLYVLGPGTTVKFVAERMGVEKTLLGVDVVHNGRLVARDVDEETLYRLVTDHRSRGGRVKIILSPIGGQGYILGRGNQQISPRVVRAAGGRDALVVIATRAKLSKLKVLRVDTGDPELDKQLSGYVRVIVDYGEEEVRRVE